MNPEQAHRQGATVVHRLLVGLVTAVCRRPRLVLAAAVVLSVLSLIAFTTRLEYRTQRSDLINPNKDYQQRWRQYTAEFGNDEDMVVVVEGGDRARMQAALEALGTEVRRRPDTFDRLFYKVDLRHLHNRALLYLPAEQITQIQGNLQSMSPLLEIGPLGWELFTLDRLVGEAGHRADNLQPPQPLTPADQQFFTQLVAISKSATAAVADPAQYRNPWRSLLPPPCPPPGAGEGTGGGQQDLLAEPQYFFSGDGALAFLLVRPVKEEGSFTAARKSVDAMRAVVDTIRPQYPDLQFGLTGLPVLENDEMVAAQQDTRLASWLAIAGVTLLFIVVYRSIWYPLLTVVTLLIGTTWAMGWLTLTVGHLNILSATFAVMLIGMGDYGVLWVMRYEQARHSGLGVLAALRHTTIHVAIGNLTAATTLALAFFAAMLADFQAVAELGWIAGCGVLLCALACFTVLPALLMIFDRRPMGGQTSAPGGLRLLTPDCCPLTPDPCSGWLPGVLRRPGWVIAAGLAVTVVLAVFACRIGYDHNLLHLQARGLDSVKWELKLIDHTAGASWHALSYTATPQEALALKQRYEQLPGVSRVVEMASLVPADQESKLAQLRDIQRRLRNLPRRGEAIPRLTDAVVPGIFPGTPGLKQDLKQVGERLGRHGDEPLLAEVRDSLSELHDQLDELPDDVAGQRLRAFEQHLAGDLAEDLHRLREVSTPAVITTADLPPELRERYIGKSGKWLLCIFARDCLWDFPPLERFTQEIATVDPAATGKPFATVEGLKAMKSGFQWAGLYAFAVIVVVLLVDYRNLRNTLLALAPLAMGVVLSLGIMGVCGLPLNPANMIAFPLILGVGVDNGVHVLHDFLLRRAAGGATISRAIGRGVLVKALTTMIGFGTLMISSERGLAGLGLILTLGVGCCMLSALVVLPALLRLLAGQSPIQQMAEPAAPVRRAA
jgi:hopanoid biosynthesis associated RND transporter like protein HpnN